MSAKPITQQVCNTQACEESYPCASNGCGWYPGETDNAGYYYRRHSDDYDGPDQYIELALFGPYNTTILWGNQKYEFWISAITCDGKRGILSDCSTCLGEIDPYYGKGDGYAYIFHGCCNNCLWNNGTSWFWYGNMGIKRRPV